MTEVVRHSCGSLSHYTGLESTAVNMLLDVARSEEAKPNKFLPPLGHLRPACVLVERGLSM